MNGILSLGGIVFSALLIAFLFMSYILYPLKRLIKKIGTKKIILIVSLITSLVCLFLTVEIALTLFIFLFILAVIFITSGKQKNIIVFIVLTVYFFSALGFMLPGHCVVRETARRISCRSNLKQIGTCLFMYAGDNDGHFPDKGGDAGFEMLIDQNYLSDYWIYTCPSSNDDYQESGPLKSSYIYHGGLTTAAPADTVLVEDNPGNHEKYVNYLYCDISVKGESNTKFQSRWHDYSKNLIITRLMNWFRK